RRFTMAPTTAREASRAAFEKFHKRFFVCATFIHSKFSSNDTVLYRIATIPYWSRSVKPVKKKKNRKRKPQETDRRVEKSKKAVLGTVYEWLTKSGLSGVSVEEVSRRSGVAKTTIYRHWPSRESLLLDACSQLSTRPLVPHTGNLRTDLETLACGTALRLQQPW